MILKGTPAIIAIILIVAVCIIFSIYIFIRSYKSDKEEKEKREEELLTDEEPEFKVTGAVILNKQSVMHTTRHDHSVEYKITFMTDDGETVEMPVPQEIYAELYESQSGDLVTINGNYFYFGDGEPVNSTDEEERIAK